jgi:hypothetical protein
MVTLMRCGKKCKAKRAIDDNMAHAHFMLDACLVSLFLQATKALGESRGLALVCF